MFINLRNSFIFMSYIWLVTGTLKIEKVNIKYKGIIEYGQFHALRIGVTVGLDDQRFSRKKLMIA